MERERGLVTLMFTLPVDGFLPESWIILVWLKGFWVLWPVEPVRLTVDGPLRRLTRLLDDELIGSCNWVVAIGICFNVGWAIGVICICWTGIWEICVICGATCVICGLWATCVIICGCWTEDSYLEANLEILSSPQMNEANCSGLILWLILGQQHLFINSMMIGLTCLVTTLSIG